MNTAQSYKHSLECLRLEAACKQAANGVSTQELRTHFIRMARSWSELSEAGLAEPAATAVAPENRAV